MTLTLLALFLIPFCLSGVLNPKGSHAIMRKVIADETLSYIFAFLLLLLVLMIFSETGFDFSWSWNSVLPIIGALTALKAVFLFFPSFLKKKLKWIEVKHMPICGFVGLIFALALVYIDTQLIT